MNTSVPLRVRRASRLLAASLPLLVLVLGPASVTAQTTLTIDPATRFQTLSGWECVTFAAQDDPAFPLFKDALFDRVIHEAGINRVRLEVRSGAENSTDYFAQYRSGQVDYATWRANRYATVNDNADSNVLHSPGFHFTELDRNVQTTILPLRAMAAAKGEPLYLNLNYVAFTGQIAGGNYHHQNPAEYAEFILAVFQHLDRQFGFVPDALEILLEPDNVSQWNNGTTLGNAIVAVEARLSAGGYSPEIIAPSCTHMGNAVSYFDALALVPGALSALDEICYHRYGGVSDANLQALAARGLQHDKRTSMLEWWSPGNGIDVLFKDLTMGRNGAWQQGVLAGTGGLDDDMALYRVNTNAPAPVVQINRQTRLMRQVYRFVRRGAVRVAATTSNNTFQPVAFINADGGHVVVIRATAGGSFNVMGLPAGPYGVNYSTASQFNASLPAPTIASGGLLTTSIPAAGALTVYSLRPTLTASVSPGYTLNLTVRSLKPGFTGSVERNDDPSQAGGWQEVGASVGSDFLFHWSGPVGAAPAFYRFRQP